MDEKIQRVGLVKTLEMMFASPHERKQLAKTIDPRLTTFELGAGLGEGGKQVNVREHLLTGLTEETTLVQEEVYKEIQRGAQPMRCFRDVLPIYKTKAPVLEIPLGRDASNIEGTYYSRAIADGSPGMERTEGYDLRTITTKTYREVPTIAQNLIDDTMFQVVADQFYFAGQRLENQLNMLAVTAMLNNAGMEHDCVNADLGVKAVAYGRRDMLAKHYVPDTLVICPEAECSINIDTTFGPKYGWGMEQLRANVLGLDVYLCSVPDNASSYTWSYNSDGDMGMLLLDKRHAGAIAMRQDISVMPFKDPIRDIQAANIKARFAVGHLYPNAICRVEF